MADDALSVLRITPSGEDVPLARQIVFTFDQPVVPIGKMDRAASEIPISIKPKLACEWRWLNTSSLACQLNDKNRLKAASHYHISIKPGIMTESGKTLAAPYQHQFITKRPKLSYQYFDTWLAPSMPVVKLNFTQKISRASVLKHLYFKAKKQRYRIKIAPEDENETDYSKHWLIQSQQLLPKNSAVSLELEPGLQPQIGTETSIEKTSLLKLHTFPSFRFLGVQCENNQGDKLIFAANKKRDLKRQCNPMQSIALLFNSPVSNNIAENLLKITPPLSDDLDRYDPWEDVYDGLNLGNHHKDQVYKLWIPALLKAYQTYQFRAQAKGWTDQFGRQLKRRIHLDFRTDHRPPMYVFEHNLSVLEQGVDSELPIVVTNLKKIGFDYQILSPNNNKTAQSLRIPIKKIKDVAYRMPFGIRKLLKGKSGVVSGNFYTEPKTQNTENEDENEWFFSQVTPYHIHAKLGHNNSLVWITDFASGQPVSGAKVSIYKGNYQNLEPNPNNLGLELTDIDGIAHFAGRKQLDPELKLDVYDQEKNRLIIRVQKGDNIALLPLDNQHQQGLYQFVSNYELYSDVLRQYEHIRAWGTTAQGIYRTGETIQFKIWLRDQDNKHFIPAPKASYQLKITDAMGNSVHEVKNITLSEFGAYDGEFKLEKTASTGWYNFEISADFIKDKTWQPMRVLVSDFTPAPFKVSNSISGARFQAGDIATVETRASLHAGGPYADAHTRVSVLLQPRPFTPNTKISQDFQFDTLLDEFYDETIFETEAQGDDKGQHSIEFKVNGNGVIFGKLLIESTVRDERGKDVASRVTADYNGRDRYVGIRQDQWLLSAGKTAKIPLLVVDSAGNAIAGSRIKTQIEYRETKASRVKGAGNAYLSKYIHEWIKVSQCETLSKADSTVNCEFIPEKSGRYRISATIQDSKNREHKTTYNQWVSGSSSVVWESNDNNQLNIEPEQTSYAVGDKARYLIKNPYPGAKALITIERYGIIDSWVQTLDNSVEILEIPIKADYLPGFYLSVMTFSGRQDKPISASLIDLGKPSYKMGYVKTNVNDPYKTLQIQISSDKPIYKPREQATLNIKVDSVHQDHQQPIELAIAVLDESVFALLSAGLSYYDPYKGFYDFQYIDVSNYNFMDQLVGRQRFAKKGANPGGDGGSNLSLRDLFKFVSYWNPSIKTDQDGKAQIKFNVPDNLTGWRVLVMATTPYDYMGLGDYNFKVNKTLELRPVLPNQILQGDQFDAGFSLMNRSESAQDISVSIKAQQNGDIIGLQKQTIHIKPYKRQTFTLKLSTDTASPIILTASANTATDDDALQISLPVLKRRVNQVAASYGSFDSDSISESIAYPQNIHSDTGGLSLTLSPSILGNMSDSFQYMRDYPYSCWEQTLSKGLAAQYYSSLKDWLPKELDWQNHQNLPDQALARAAEFQAPNGGMAYFSPKDEHVSPYLSAFTAVGFAWLRDHGKAPSPVVLKNLQNYLQTLLKQDQFPNYYSKGMGATTRAVALYALSRYGKVHLTDMRRFMPHLPYMSLFGKSLFLRTTMRLSNNEAYRKQIFDSILAQSDQSSGQVRFNEILDDSYRRILASPMRDNCAVLSALIDYDKQSGNQNQDLIQGLARSLSSARKSKNHWGNTQENLFCMQAMLDYASAYEQKSPYLQIKATLGKQSLGKGEIIGRGAAPLQFKKPMSAADIGQKMPLNIERQGDGRLYYQLRLRYAELDEQAQAVNAGIEIQREYSVKRNNTWQKLNNPMQLQSGELVRIDLYLSLPSARDFVVVDDPVPGGLEPVNRDLATASVMADREASNDYAGGSIWFMHNDWNEFGYNFWSFYHRELRHHAVRYYADRLPAGNYHLSYIAQAIVPGNYQIMPSHTEQMYEPDVYGNSKPARLIISK